MRFFLLALATLGLTAPGQPSAEGRPIVLFVHGRGHLDGDSAGLRRAWKRDLDASLRAVGADTLHDADARLVWYADVMDPTREDPCAATPGAGASETRGFVHAFAALISDVAMDNEARALRGALGDVLYFVEPATRCAAEARVADALRVATEAGRPVILMAYSLGSLVTYGVLNRVDAAALPANLHLITLGSPLGIPTLREFVFGDSAVSSRARRRVRSWTNLYDINDPFSGRVGFGSSEAGFLDRAIADTTAEDPHRISRYLRDPATAHALTGTLRSAIGSS